MFEKFNEIKDGGIVTPQPTPAKQPENYVFGMDSIPSLTSQVGERKNLSSSSRKGVYQDMPCDIWEYSYESNTVFEDLLKYLNMLKKDYGFIHITDMDLNEPAGDTSLAVESKERGKLIVLDCNWTANGYQLKFTKVEGVLTKYD